MGNEAQFQEMYTTNHYTRNENKQLFTLYMNTIRDEDELYNSYEGWPYSVPIMEVEER
jgi:hypothetical protein